MDMNFGEPVGISKAVYKQKLIEKWSKSNLLKNLNPYNQTIIAQLCENTQNELKTVLKENMTTGDIASFYKLAFPMLRRTFAQLTITELVSTQAVDLPETQIFYLDMVYDGANRYNLAHNVSASTSATTMIWSNGAGTLSYPYGLSSNNSHILNDYVNFDPTFSGPDRTDYYEGSSAIPRIKFKISKTDMKVHTRKLQVEWTQEIEQDVSAYHGIDAEKTLTQFLGEYIALEINNEVLADVRKYTLKNRINLGSWDEDMNSLSQSIAATKVGYMTFYGTQLDWNKMLVYEINKVSNRIKASTHRSGANWCVVSPDTASILETVSGFDADSVSDGLDFTVGVSKNGTLSKKWKIYVDTMVDSMWRAVPALHVYTWGVNTSTGSITAATVNALADESNYIAPNTAWATSISAACITIGNTSASSTFLNQLTTHFGLTYSTTAAVVATTIAPDGFVAATYDWWGRNDVLLGYKGENFMDAGYVFSPYTMGILTPVIYEPYTYNYKRGIMSRYGKKMIRDGYYGRVEVALKTDDLTRLAILKQQKTAVADWLVKYHPNTELTTTSISTTSNPNY